MLPRLFLWRIIIVTKNTQHFLAVCVITLFDLGELGVVLTREFRTSNLFRNPGPAVKAQIKPVRVTFKDLRCSWRHQFQEYRLAQQSPPASALAVSATCGTSPV